MSRKPLGSPPSILDKWQHLFGCYLARKLIYLHDCEHLIVSSHLRLSLQDMDKEENYKYHPYWVSNNMRETKLKPSKADWVEEKFYRNSINSLYSKYIDINHQIKFVQ